MAYETSQAKGKRPPVPATNDGTKKSTPAKKK
jgi:hypothetical protein